jgi:hypothetical protein
MMTVTPEGALKSTYALRAMGGELDFDAVNVSANDLTLGKLFFDTIGEKYPDAMQRLISASIYDSDQPDKRSFQPFRVVERRLPGGGKAKVLIIGSTTSSVPASTAPVGGQIPVGRNFKLMNPAEAIRVALAEAPPDVDLRVVLHHGAWQEATEIAKANPSLDVIACSSFAPDNNNKYTIEGNTALLGLYTYQGKQLGRADLTPGGTRKWNLAGVPAWLGVSPKNLKAAQPLLAMIDDYKKQTQDLAAPRPADAKMVYAGAHTCNSCHLDQFKSWQETQHAHAYQTLVAKGSQFDNSCLKCHTLGFQKDNGFYNYKQSALMVNVQCENCHGPALDHVNRENLIKGRGLDNMTEVQREDFLELAKKAIPSKIVEEATCQQCHYGSNDPHFDYGKKIHLVNHKPLPEGVKPGHHAVGGE